MSETIQIQMQTTYAGPKGLFPAGSVVSFEREEAQGLIDGGYAVQVEAGAKVEAETEAAEGVRETTAAVHPGAETPEVVRENGFVKPKKKA